MIITIKEKSMKYKEDKVRGAEAIIKMKMARVEELKKELEDLDK